VELLARGFVVQERAVEVDAREAKHDAHLLLAIQPKHLALLADQPRAAIGRRRVAVVEPLDRQVHREEAGDLAVRAHARNVPQLRVHVGDGFEQLDWHSAVTIDSI